ncbi:MAG: hypothetical protein ABI970_19280, partial [Chloroflexota bacterium]
MTDTKILICGYSSNTVEFIECVNEFHFTADSIPIRMSFGRISVDDDFHLYFYSLVEQLAPDRMSSDMWHMFREGALGVIILLDSRKDIFQGKFSQIQSLLRFIIEDHQKTTVIGVEFQSDPNALSAEHIQAVLNIPPLITAQPQSQTA